MNWERVILFAILIGIYTGVILMVDCLYDTSFQDIGVLFEWWVIFAVIIVVNCHKSWEAMLKCFVFFLISQPIIYGVQVLAGSLALDTAIGYYVNYWFVPTLLTLPGGFIAYFCKKQNWIGAVILGLGNCIQAFMGAHYVVAASKAFPHHILSIIVCFGSIIVMTNSIHKKKVNRAIAYAIPATFTVLLVAYVMLNDGVYL